jgi:hypothetical protein
MPKLWNPETKSFDDWCWDPRLGRPVAERCVFCGSTEGSEVQESGHYKMTCCNQVLAGCCGD